MLIPALEIPKSMSNSVQTIYNKIINNKNENIYIYTNSFIIFGCNSSFQQYKSLNNDIIKIIYIINNLKL